MDNYFHRRQGKFRSVPLKNPRLSPVIDHNVSGLPSKYRSRWISFLPYRVAASPVDYLELSQYFPPTLKVGALGNSQYFGAGQGQGAPCSLLAFGLPVVYGDPLVFRPQPEDYWGQQSIHRDRAAFTTEANSAYAEAIGPWPTIAIHSG
jgi:hypothetical protein